MDDGVLIHGFGGLSPKAPKPHTQKRFEVLGVLGVWGTHPRNNESTLSGAARRSEGTDEGFRYCTFHHFHGFFKFGLGSATAGRSHELDGLALMERSNFTLEKT